MKTIAFMLVSLFCVTNLSAQNNLVFWIVNDTDIDLYGVYVSASVDDDWGEDILPDTFDSGTTVKVTIPIDRNTMCVQDIKITDHHGEGVVFSEIDFCELSTLTFYVGHDGHIYYRTE